VGADLAGEGAEREVADLVEELEDGQLGGGDAAAGRLLLGEPAALGDEVDDGLDDTVEVFLEVAAEQGGLRVW